VRCGRRSRAGAGHDAGECRNAMLHLAGHLVGVHVEAIEAGAHRVERVLPWQSPSPCGRTLRQPRPLSPRRHRYRWTGPAAVRATLSGSRWRGGAWSLLPGQFSSSIKNASRLIPGSWSPNRSSAAGKGMAEDELIDRRRHQAGCRREPRASQPGRARPRPLRPR
jgi:hypothetical protein